MPRFVVLLHETPKAYERKTHYDFMLEADGVLKTWALDELPTAGGSVAAERLSEHRLAYLEYEGEISGGRGQVRRVDEGEYRAIEESANHIVIQAAGARFRGLVTLQMDERSQRWRVSLAADGTAAAGAADASEAAA